MNPSLLDRLTPPAAAPFQPFALPVADVQPLAGGAARLHLLPNRAQPAVQVQIVLPAGTYYEPSPALALLTARTLTEGTRQRTAGQLAEAFAYYGAFFECQNGPDRASLTLYCLTHHLSALLPLLGELLTEATFPEREVAAVQQRLAQAVRVDREKSAYLATERFTRKLFGAAHPYCTEIDLDRLLATTPDEVRGFYATHYTLRGAEVFLAGDFTNAHVAELMAVLPVPPAGPAPVAPTLAPAADLTPDEIRQPEALQSAVRVGRHWPAPTHPDTHRLSVLNKVLGGYFGSRLMKNIREDKGFTYGIYSSINHREHANSFGIAADVNVESTAATFAEIAHELRTLTTEPVPAEELDLVRNYTIGKFLSETSTVFDQLGKYRYLVLHQLPATYYTDMLATIQTVTATELLALAQQYLQPADMLEVAVGRRGES